ncbi:damage-inducible protein DinB [Ruegeria marisrubri]|uniref:Damage-inducible protein DinB n=1 Tax=Ruegeria marisrubri TaxID=1685379 RepID=A0A117KH25_9RHOB|nr:DinB family protein [Ruegeria marisrubri]KUJ85875.1 damage-inducible protein DinB [Ruegeria marisrubri]
MISAEFARQMARYNAWQNRQLAGCLAALDPKELTKDRGAFFGSILGTANHLLWADWLWVSRFDGGPEPGGGIPESVSICADLEEWRPTRLQTDARIADWVDKLEDAALTGELTWHSAVLGQDVTRPYALCVVHFFNHQTHHRGQLHQMLTEAGAEAPVSDLVFMPEEP